MQRFAIISTFISSLLFMISVANSNEQDIDISGLVLDSTISRQGQEFSRQVSRYWQEIPNTVGQNVVIKEVIVPQAGTMLEVVLDNRIVYRTYLGRRLSPINEKVEQAVLVLVDALSRADQMTNSPDLAPDEW